MGAEAEALVKSLRCKQVRPLTSKMASAAYQTFAYDRMGAFHKVEKACSVAEANAILKTLHASAGNIRWHKIAKIASAAYQTFGYDRQGAYGKVMKAKTVA